MGTLKNWITTTATAIALHTTIASAQEAPKTAEHTAHQVAVVLADATPAIQAEMTSIVVTAKVGEADLKKNLDTTAKPGQVAVTIVTPAGVTPPVLDATSLGAIQVESISQTVEPTTTPVSPADSAIATAAKGYGQEVTLKDGSKLSFADVAKMGTKEQDTVIEQVEGAKNRLRLTAFLKEYASNIEQVAIEGNKEKLTAQQVAIEEGKKIDQGTQVATEILVKNATSLAITIKTALTSGLKLDTATKSTMEALVAYGKPPETVKYFQTILADAKNFSA